MNRFATPIQLGFAAAVLAVYVLTLYPSSPGGDSGELIAAAYRLGVAHPPGYPLYTLLGKASTLLPIGTIAWRVNLLTALFGALAATLTLRTTWRMNGSLGAGLIAGGLFAFSPLVWRYAVGAEVFSLNNLFMATLVALLVSHEEERRPRTVYAFAFALGLGLTNHQTLLFCGAPMLLWMLVRSRRTMLRPLPLAATAGAAVAGLFPYLYLFARPSDHPLTTWGDTSTISGFLTHVTRAEYGSLRLAGTERSADLVASMGAYLSRLPYELLWVGVPLALLALPLMRHGSAGRRMTVRALWLVLAVNLFVFHALSNMPLEEPLFYEIHSRFWQQPNLIVCVLAGCGFAWLGRERLGLAPAGLALAALGVVGIQLGLHYAAEDQSDNDLVVDLARKTLAVVPPDALVISRGDLLLNSLRYVQVCEGVRPDVRLLDIEMLESPWMAGMVRRHHPGVTLPGEFYRAPSRAKAGSYDLLQLVEANIGNASVMSNALDERDTSWAARYTTWPVGFYDRFYPKGTRIDVDAYTTFTERWAGATGAAFPDSLSPGSWEAVARQHFASAEGRRGTRLLEYAVTGPGLRPDQLGKVGAMLETALALDADPDPGLYLNAGIYYYMMKGKIPDAVDRMIDVWTEYRLRVPGDTPEGRMVDPVLADPENARLMIGAR